MAKNSFRHVETMIGEDAVIRGHVVLKGGAIISGKVYGNVMTDGPVRLTRTGMVQGDVTSSDAFIGGVVEGNLTTSGKVVLRSYSVVRGDIVYRQLVIEEGASFEGRCDVAPPAGQSGDYQASESKTVPETVHRRRASTSPDENE